MLWYKNDDVTIIPTEKKQSQYKETLNIRLIFFCVKEEKLRAD